VLASGANAGDIVDVIAYGTVSVANTYTQAQADAKFVDVAGDTMTGDLNFGDNDKAIFGAGSDLQIYHDGSNSYITEGGDQAGDLFVRASNLKLTNASGDFFLWGRNADSVRLYHNNAQKLETTATGVDVTGTAAVTTVDFGNWTITESGGSLYFATGGTNKMKLDASGNLDVVGNVNTNATIT